MASIILSELNKVNDLFNIIDTNLLLIDNETLEFINKREELRQLKQFELTDQMRDTLKEKFIFEDDNTGYSLINKF